MPDPRKITIVDEAAGKIANAGAVFFTDFKGLSAPKATELRARLRENNIEYLVVKKTFAKLAAEKAGVGDIQEYIDGQMAMAITMAEPSDPAKILTDFSKKNNDVPTITGIILDGQLLPGDKAKELAAMPSREALYGQLLSVINQPMTKLAAALKSPMSKLAQLLASLKEQKS
ncbi:MAG: 50S ribosomal protein L10 [Candidatus Marinimicrobia bacterium]|nr:50S ribosomal protein L10 [Candidatus Neomarinimicrobiota bacterium]